jgi:Mrp family chromosome partitioning ATPase
MPRKTQPRYEQKFANFIEMIAQTKLSGVDFVLIHSPEALGDTYAEMVESLNRLATAELALRILPPSARAKPGRN